MKGPPYIMELASQCIGDNTLVGLLEGEIGADALAAIEHHVDRCESCRVLIADLADRTRTLELGRRGTVVLTDDRRVDVHPASLGWLQRMGRSDTHYEAGEKIDHYEVIRELGQGGMGEVYLARDEKLGRRVALKVVSRQRLENHGDPEQALAQFMNEARTTARLSHPNIVTIHGVGEHEGRPYLALEYIKGKTLKRFMRDVPRRPLRETLRISVAIADALVAAHGHGVLHRDLKPDNVLVSHDGRVRVVDFGLAETIEHDMSETTRRQTSRDVGPVVPGVVGTPKYMAPEQWEDEERSGATDIWALGLIMYELITGRHPLEDLHEISDVVAATISDAPVDPLVLPDDPDMEDHLRPLVASMLAKDPKLRPTVGFVAGVLRSHYDRLGVVVPESTTERASATRYVLAFAALAAGGAAAYWLLADRSAVVVATPTRAAPSVLAGSAAPTMRPTPSLSGIASGVAPRAPTPNTPPTVTRRVPPRVEAPPATEKPAPAVPEPSGKPPPKDPLDVF